jgi:hypothetical protein
MTSNLCKYLPEPPRAWYRVENDCTSVNNINVSSQDLLSYYERVAQVKKGNVLQYKKNSSNLTKKQQYAQVAKGMWTNRTKTWATQSDIYSNPNIKCLQRVNYLETDNPNPNVLAVDLCPFATTFKDGGTLVCGTYQNPCTGEVIKAIPNSKYHPSSDSNVPGPIVPLYWDEKITPWYPRQRYTMNNSTDKWPQNYKLFVSALHKTSDFY